MMPLKKQVNIHKVISNLKCTAEDGKLSVSFNNTAIGTIVALKLTLKGINNAGKTVTINRQQSFPVMISNILIAPNKKASGLKAELPSAEISKVEVQQIQVIYQEDSRILDVPEQKMVEYNINALDDFSDEETNGITEHEQLMCLKEKNKMFICYPSSHAVGWICACGNLNGKDIARCINCGEEYSTVKKYTKERIIKECLAAKPKQEQKKEDTPSIQESAKAETEKQESQKQEAAKPAPAKQEPVKQEAAKPAPAKQEPVKQEAAKPAPAKQEPVKQEPAKQKTEAPAKPKQVQAAKKEAPKPTEKAEAKTEPEEVPERRHVNNELTPEEKKRIIITAALISAGFIALVTVLLILVL